MPWHHFTVLPRSGWAAPGLQRGLAWLVSGPSDTVSPVSAVVTSVFPGLRGYPLIPLNSLRSDCRAGIKTQENTLELSSLRAESSVGDVELGAISCWSFEDKHQPETSSLLRAWMARVEWINSVGHNWVRFPIRSARDEIENLLLVSFGCSGQINTQQINTNLKCRIGRCSPCKFPSFLNKECHWINLCKYIFPNNKTQIP